MRHPFWWNKASYWPLLPSGAFRFQNVKVTKRVTISIPTMNEQIQSNNTAAACCSHNNNSMQVSFKYAQTTNCELRFGTALCTTFFYFKRLTPALFDGASGSLIWSHSILSVLRTLSTHVVPPNMYILWPEMSALCSFITNKRLPLTLGEGESLTMIPERHYGHYWFR